MGRLLNLNSIFIFIPNYLVIWALSEGYDIFIRKISN